MALSERICRMAEEIAARAEEPRTSPKEANWSKAFFELYADPPLWERQARSFVYALLEEPMHRRAGECIAGQIYQGIPGAGAPEQWGAASDPRWSAFAAASNAQRVVERELPENALYGRYFGDGAYAGHVTWDYGMILREGISGMLARVDALASTADDAEASEFYGGVRIVWEGVAEWVSRYADLLEGSEEHRDLAAICRRVPWSGAQTFQEALHSFWLTYLAVMFENPCGGNGPGRLDWYLWPYLDADLAAGRATLDYARELVAELFIKIDERIRIHDGWVEAIVVGGRDPSGKCAVNPLSHIMVETIMDLNQTHPSVYMRVPDDAPKEFLDLAARYTVESTNRAQVYADDAIIRALVQDGIPIEDARQWGAGGCMEVAVQGMACDLVFSFAHNVVRTLEAVINGGRLLLGGDKVAPIDASLADYATFEDLYEAFDAELRRELGILCRRLDIWEAKYAKYRPTYLLSSMTHDCLERGRNQCDGGARYPNHGGSGVGIPNVGDSLTTIKRVVYDEKRVDAGELLAALRADFEGHEALRAYLLSIPKYGSGDADATAMVDRVLRSFTELLVSHRTPHGGHCYPIILGFTWVVDMGLTTGATADGRLAGMPLAHGLAPQSGSAVSGLTAAIGDATSLSLDRVPGGGAMMWDLDHSWASQEVVRPIIEAYIRRGGHIFQGNVVKVDDLRRAQEHPEEYRDLMVRVGGYSARFTALSRETQEEIIARQKHRG